MSTAVPLQLGH